jgi:Uma2 family endonuclease
MAIPFPHHLFTVDDYYRMAESGILREGDRVELIDGEIIDMAPIGSEHAGHVTRFTRRFTRLFDDRATVNVQNPIHLGERSEPEPDIALLHPRDDDYVNALPTAADVFLLIEVAESSLAYDRQTKAPMYARAGIPELWIVNLIDHVIEVYRDPADGQYQRVEIMRRGDQLQPLAFPDVSVAVSDVLI